MLRANFRRHIRKQRCSKKRRKRIMRRAKRFKKPSSTYKNRLATNGAHLLNIRVVSFRKISKKLTIDCKETSSK